MHLNTYSNPVNDCFQFTWQKDKNASEVTCNKIEDKPCNYPFIITGDTIIKSVLIICEISWQDIKNLIFFLQEPADKPPNVTDLEFKCDSMSCSPFTCTPETTCIKYAIYDITSKYTYL